MWSNNELYTQFLTFLICLTDSLRVPTLAALASAGEYMGSYVAAGATGLGARLSAFLFTPFLSFAGVAGAMTTPLPPLTALPPPPPVATPLVVTGAVVAKGSTAGCAVYEPAGGAAT